MISSPGSLSKSQDADRYALLFGNFNHVGGAFGFAIPRGNQGVRMVKHFLIAEITGVFAAFIPLGRETLDGDAALFGVSLAQRVRAPRRAADDGGRLAR